MEYANLIMHSDVLPFKIVKWISEKTIEIQEMDAKLLNPDELIFHVGGFAGHCSNNHEARYEFKPRQDAPIIRARKRKDGAFHSKLGRHVLAHYPRKFYDYNF